jgi:DNA-binding transcriptional ArsR family regulator
MNTVDDKKKKNGSDRIVIPKEEILYDLADFFRVFGDSTRIKILYLLFKKEMCVGDIASTLNMNQSAISHQLKILKQTRLAHSRKEGKLVYYFLNDDHIERIMDQGYTHIVERRSP